MGYKWRPSKTARREFAQKMNNDTEFREAYLQRKADRAEKRRAGSRFDYESAGGFYQPTEAQYHGALRLIEHGTTSDQMEACNMVISGYTCGEKVHHDYIHIVNEFIRGGGK